MSPNYRPIRSFLVILMLLLLATTLTARNGRAAQPDSRGSTLYSTPGEAVGVSFPGQFLTRGSITTAVVTVRNNEEKAWQPALLSAVIEFTNQDGIVVATGSAADAVQETPIAPGDLADLVIYLSIPSNLPDSVSYRTTVKHEEATVASWVGKRDLRVKDQTEEEQDQDFTSEAGYQIEPQSIQAIETDQNVDLVFAMDTSGSMGDEFSAICGTINNVVQDIQSRGINLNYRILGITSTWYCATETVAGLVPGGLVNHSEDWGPATSDLANGYTWQPGYVRLIVPVSDEAPQNGGTSCDSSDQVSITTAIADANRANVRVSPILGILNGGYVACIEQLAQELADETGGRLFYSNSPDQDIADGIIEIVGGAVHRSYITVNPSSVSLGGSATVTVTIRDENNQLVSGHQVRVSSNRGGLDTINPAVGMTNAQGQFITTITSQSRGVAILSAHDLTANEPVIGTAQVTFGTVTNPPSAAPRIVDVQSDSLLEGMYGQGMGPLPNSLDVTIDWQGGAPGTVDFELNGIVLTSKNATSDLISHTIDFGALQIGQNILRVVARNSIGEQVKSFVITGWQIPDWMILAQSKLPIPKADYLEIEVNVPGTPLWGGYDFQWLMKDRRSTAKWQATGKIRLPLSGGNWEADFSGSLGHNNNTPGRPRKVLQTLKLVGHNIDKIETGILLGGIVDENGIDLADFAWEAGVTFEEFVLLRATLLEMLNAFPPGGTTVYLSLKRIPPVEKAVGMIAQATLGVTPHINFTADLIQQNDLDLAATLDLGGDIDLTVAILNGTAKAYAGIGFGIDWLADTISDHCIGAYADGHAGYIVNIILWEQSEEYQVDLGRTSFGDCLPTRTFSSPGWEYKLINYQPWHIPRGDFGSKYTKLIAEPMQMFDLANLTGAEAVAASLSDTILFSNVYGNAKPSLAWAPDGSQGMIVWTYDDPGKTAGQGLEIATSYYDGVAWSPRVNITNDTLPDTGARVTRSSDGRFITVWERINDPALSPDAPFDATSWSKTEVMAAVFNPATSTWSTPVKIHSDNIVLDYSPKIAANNSGAALAAWRHNEGDELVGTDTHPDDLLYARWNGSAWTSGTVASGLVSMNTLDLTYQDTDAAIAWSQTITPTGVITGTEQIFASTFDGANWAPPQQITSGEVDHASPQAFYTLDGTPAVAWVEDGKIIWRTLPSGPILISNLSQQADEFQLANNAAGNLVAVWSEQGDILLSLFDWDDNLWSAPANLTEDIDLETYLGSAFEDTGILRIGYANTHMTEEIRSGTTDNGQVITYTAKIPGPVDLNLLSLLPFSNLTADEIVVTPEGAGAAADVAVTVSNNGYFAADNVAIDVYDGDPGAGGSLIDAVTLPDPLAAGITQTVTVTHTIDPTAGMRTFWAVVDPADAITEIDETDNETSLRALGPNLVIDAAVVNYASGSMVDFETITRNYGTADSGPATIEFYLNEISGAPIATATLPTLSPGEEIIVLTPWDFGSLAPGDHPVVAVVNRSEADFAEIELTDNEYNFSLQVAADLVIDPLYFKSEPGANGSVTMQTTVFNFGEVAASNVPITFYDASGASLTEIGSATIASLPAGGSAEAEATWSTPPNQFSLTVIADPDSTLVDSRRDNNAATLIPGFQLAAPTLDLVVAPGETVEVTVDVRSVGGFNDLVLLEVLDLPPGGTATITPSEIAPPGSATVQISVPADAPLAAYPVRVVGTSGDLSATAVVNLDVNSYVVHEIRLNAGWNMISTYVDPSYPALASLLADIESDMILIKNGHGEVYWPDMLINTIGEWDMRHGYQVYMNNPATLSISGQQVDPSQTPIDLLAKWSMVAYLRNSPMPIDAATVSLGNSLVLIKTGDGKIYWPALGINTIHVMQPGQGYKMYLNTATTLVYPAE